MHQVSDGERRRVQILLGLIQPFDLLLMDEVTVDLDVLVRRNLLDYLQSETEHRQATIVYATVNDLCCNIYIYIYIYISYCG